MSFLENLNSPNTTGASTAQRAASNANNAVKDTAQLQSSKAVYNTDNPREAALAGAAAKIANGGLSAFLDALLEEQKDSPTKLYTNGEESRNEDNSFTNIYSDKINFDNYGFDNDVNDVDDLHPAMKHMFFCEFHFDENFKPDDREIINPMKQISAFVKNTTFPSVTVEANIYNEYNRRKVHPRKLQYQDVNVSIGETVQNYVSGDRTMSVLDFWLHVMKDLYNDFMIEKTDGTYHFGHKSGKTFSNPIKYFDIFIIWANKVKRLRLVNPIITTFSYDGLDYGTDDQIIANFNFTYDYFSLDNYKINLIDEANNLNSNNSPFERNPNWEYIRNKSILPVENSPEIIPTQEPTYEFKDQRGLNLDNPLAQALLDVAETEALQASAGLLNSDDPQDQLLGNAAVGTAMDVAGSAANATGAFQNTWDGATDAASSAGSSVRGMFV